MLLTETIPPRDLGSSPISLAKPAGDDARDSATYAAIQSQLDRLTDIHAEAAVDWSTIASLSAKVLTEEAKDLSVAVWLTAALMHQRGPEGLATGVHILRELVETYRETMFPPPARLRGRRNQMQWLLDQLTAYLQQDGESPALPTNTHAELLADWDALDEAWQLHDTDSPAFYALRRQLTDLPIADDALNSNTVPHPVDGKQNAEPPGTIAPVLMAASTLQTDSNPAFSQASASPPPLPKSNLPSTGTDPESVIDSALEQMQALVAWCLRETPTLPLLFRLNRICAWAALSEAPPSNANATRIPGPPETLVDGLAQVQQGTEGLAVVQFVEARLIDQRYWLDLNRISHAALSRVGATDAAAAVAFETSQLLARLPQLRTQTFDDDRPFADAQTLAWLDGLDAATPTQKASGHDAVEACITAAVADAASGKLDAAMGTLQATVSKADSARESFQLRLAQCDLLYRFDTGANIGSLLAPLIEELDVYQLSRWEPDLARRTLELAAAVEQRHGANQGQSSVTLLSRLARIDCHSAWRLLQINPSS